MDNHLASLQLSPDLIKPIIETHIKGAIASILGDPNDVVKAVIDKILNTKVNESGHVSNYSGDNKYNYIDIVFRQKITEVAKEEISNWAKDNSDKIRVEIQRQISTKKGSESFAKAVIDGVVKCMANTYSVRAEMSFNASDR
jgi:hypothetical protein